MVVFGLSTTENMKIFFFGQSLLGSCIEGVLCYV